VYLVPSGTWRQKVLPSATTYLAWIRLHARIMVEVAKQAGSSLATGDLFANLNLEELPDFSVQIQKRIDVEIARLRQLKADGLWQDAPQMEDPSEFEKSRLKAAAKARDRRYVQSPYEPLPDGFIAEAGWRALWLLDELGPQVVKCAKNLREALESPVNTDSKHTRSIYRLRRATKALEDFKWVDSKGIPITQLPFRLKWTSGEEQDWPPRSVGTFRSLLGLTQTAHLFIFLLSTGARIGEALSLVPGSISVTQDGSVGRTYKLVYAAEGEAKEWPLPDVAVRAIERQEALRIAMHELPSAKCSNLRGDTTPRNASDALWTRVFGSDIFTGYNELLRQWVTKLGLDAGLGRRGLHSHRFRKTLARLAGLALVGAPKILMDLFGHRSIAMTLQYILTDPQLRAETQVVAKAQTIMFAKEAIQEHMDNGGPAAGRIHTAVEQQRARLGRDFNADDIAQLAEMLTLNGTAWQLVRPGVICTKMPSESGPCAKRTGAPEPSKCRSTCAHRLEQHFLRDDVDRLLCEAVSNYRLALEVDDEIQAEEWAGQVLGNLKRFPKLEAKWRRNPTVRSLLIQQTPQGQSPPH
jgi:integrase